MAILYPTKIKMSNLGDVLINVLLVRELSKFQIVYFDSINSVLFNLVSANNPYSNNIKVIDGFRFFVKIPIVRWLYFLYTYPNLQFVFDPPGAYGQPKGKIRSFLKSKKYYLRAKILNKFGVNIVRFGVSYSKFSVNAISEQVSISKVYKGIYVRDIVNFQTLKGYGFLNLYKTNDLSFLFNIEDFYLLRTDVNFKLKSTNPFIIFSFRSTVEGDLLDKSYMVKLLNSIRYLTDYLNNQNLDIYCTYQVLEDSEPTFEVFRLLKGLVTNNIYFIEKQLNFQDAVYLYKNAYMIFSNRLHVSLWGLLCETLSFIITDLQNHSKITGIFREMNLDFLLVDIYSSDIANSIALLFNKDSDEVFYLFSQYKNLSRVSIVDDLANLLQDE